MAASSTDSEDSENMLLAPVREGEEVAKKYVAGPVLGVGGMGVVIAARDKLLGRKVAIKFLLPALAHSERAVQRFVREARAASKITSEHVVRLLEIDTLPSGMPFFVMEYLEGRDLKAELAECGTLPPGRAVDYLLQALEAVAEGHKLGVVHRDLKPGNLFVTRRADGTTLVKVLDFGIAKTLEHDGEPEVGLTGSDETRLGSPAYMSPEQLQSPSDVDARSDVWALGVTLYELLCGDHPFPGRTYTELIIAITSAAPEPPSKRRADLGLSAELDRVVMRCLEKDKARRYPSACEVASALAPFGGEDARASLKRIRGLSVPSAAGDPGHYTTTMPVDELPKAALRPGARPDRPPSGVGKRAAVGAAVVLIGLAIVALLASREPASPSSPETRAATPVEPRSPSEPAPEPPEPQATPVSTREQAVPSAPAREPPRVVSAVARRVAPATSPKPVASSGPTVEATASPEPTGATAVENDDAAGARSPLIEKLIEKRR